MVLDRLSTTFTIINNSKIYGKGLIYLKVTKQNLEILKMSSDYNIILGFKLISLNSRFYYKIRNNLGAVCKITCFYHNKQERFYKAAELHHPKRLLDNHKGIYHSSTIYGYMTMSDCIRRKVGGSLSFGLLF